MISQEHRFVADVFRFLAPFINPRKPIWLSLDGYAARMGAAKKLFPGADVPDMWFTLVGNRNPTRIEAKTLKNGKLIDLTRGQLLNWRDDDTSTDPHFWIATDLGYKSFYFWTHEFLLPKISKLKLPKKGRRRMTVPYGGLKFRSIQGLALHILAEAAVKPIRCSETQSSRPSHPQ